MKDEIKEILDDIKELIEEDETPENMKKYVGGTFNINELKILLDYITNLQQANKNHSKKIIEMGNKITNLQEENKRLKVKYDNSKSHQINYNYFKTLYEKATKDIVIDDLVYKCEDLDNLRQSYEKLYIEKEDYKSKNEKALDKLYCYGEAFDSKILQQFQKEMENILKGE